MEETSVQSLRMSARAIALYLAEVRVPWRPAANDGLTRQRVNGPREPVSLTSIDLWLTARAALRAIVAAAEESCLLNPTQPASPDYSSPVALARWLEHYAEQVAPHIDEADARDLKAIEIQLARHHGYTSDEHQDAMRRALMAERAGLPRDYFAPMREIIDVCNTHGLRVSRRTVQRWGMAGTIRMSTDGEHPTYSLADIVGVIKQRSVPTTTEAAA